MPENKKHKTNKPKTVKFFTLGCKVNQYDTQDIRERVLQTGLKELRDGFPADLYVINTCTVTQRADADSFNIIRRVRRENPRAKIVVTGCLTELDEDKIREVDVEVLIVKNEEKGDILQHISSLGLTVQGAGSLGGSIGISYFEGHTRAFLKIQDGCNNFCSYCKVPYVRGRSCSRRLDDVFEEAKKLVKSGYKEIVLCGICIGAYGKDLVPRVDIVDVIDALEGISGLSRIRLSSIEAADVSMKLIDKMSSLKILCPHLHIPIQSGDNAVLRRMNRSYTREDYLGLIKKIRDKIPYVSITTDLLVGYPAEDERAFQNSVDLVERVGPLKTHIFGYSKREGTSASNDFGATVNPAIIRERVNRLRAATETAAYFYKKQFLGRDVDVLVEERVKKDAKMWQGHTGNYLKVVFSAKEDLKNEIVRVKLEEITSGNLLGALS